MEERHHTQSMQAMPMGSPQTPMNTQNFTQGKSIVKRDGSNAPLDANKIYVSLMRATKGLEDSVDVHDLLGEVLKNIFDGVSTADIEKILILAALPFLEKDPAYNKVTTRLLLQKIYKETMGTSLTDETLLQSYRISFVQNIKRGVSAGIYDPRLLDFDLPLLAEEMLIERDDLFGYIGLQTLYERYFKKIEGKIIELPQMFWMRIAMGLSYNESNTHATAKEFYGMLSTLRYVASTPTLLHSGYHRPQLSSCYLTTIEDDLSHIFKCLGDNAQLAKWSGGIGNDWTNLRGTGAPIQSINVGSQGVIPFLKIANDVTVAISRSGSRRGATVAYLETWHYDIEEFLDLRRNTGDERRRTHDMNTANWIPDLFMKRVLEDGDWTLFTPDDVPELHHIYGAAFEKKYCAYEEEAKAGNIKYTKTIKAKDLWKKMITRLFETGHAWITFKDPCNVRSPQDHVGVIHSSNLCTEITLNTSKEETAVCNLGSICLEKHITEDGHLDQKKLAKTIKTAIRMLDNVIDINFYPTKEARDSNLRHRPIGLGIMGLQDALYKLNMNMDSEQAEEFCDHLMEFISYHAILTSSELAEEKGAYESYKGSKWDRGIFPIDTIDLLEKERGMKIDINRTRCLDWTPVYEHVKQHGMRNSNTMSIAPTATISNIAGCFPSIEPIYKNMYVKANMSGEFTMINKYLIEDLRQLGLWSANMLEEIKFHDGSIQQIERIPQALRDKYKEAFEIDPCKLINLTAARGKWIDQSQSHNIFVHGTSGKLISDVYQYAWKKGLKTTYYLRTLGASQIEKSTLDASKFGYTQKRNFDNVTSTTMPGSAVSSACSLIDPDCDTCQ